VSFGNDTSIEVEVLGMRTTLSGRSSNLTVFGGSFNFTKRVSNTLWFFALNVDCHLHM